MAASNNALPPHGLPPAIALRHGGELPDVIYPGQAPMPGAAPTPSSVAPVSYLVGEFAECSIDVSGTPVVLFALFEWEIEMRTEFQDITGHGDVAKYWTPLTIDWTASARGYCTAIGTSHYLRVGYEITGPPLMTFRGWSGPTNSGPSNLLFAGACYAERARVSVPMALAEQQIDLRGHGMPIAGIAGL